MKFLFIFLCAISISGICVAFYAGTGQKKHTSLLMLNPKPSGIANTKEGKAIIYERAKKLVDKSAIIITVPIEGVNKEDVDALKKSLPKSTKASVVKNAIFKKVVADTQFAALIPSLRDETLFLFVAEGDGKSVYDSYKKWQKEVKKGDDRYNPKAAAIENLIVTGSGIESVVNLPSKLELITKVAQGIKAVPTKLARGIKAVPDKVGRAFAGVRDKIAEKENVIAASAP